MASRRPPQRRWLRRFSCVLALWLTVLSLTVALPPTSLAEADPRRDSGSREAATPAFTPENTTAVPSTGVWSWPLAPLPPVVRPFERPATAYGPGHRGLDLAAASDQPVLAVDGGVVTHSGEVAGRGTVTVRHASGVASTYEPLQERVPTGSVVARGDVIGVIGPSQHCSPRWCLHLGARFEGDYLDPLLLLARVRIVLLPLEAA